jgi:hypothetical protein
MGVKEFDAWCTATSRQGSTQSSPERWDGEDRWFSEQHASRQ